MYLKCQVDECLLGILRFNWLPLAQFPIRQSFNGFNDFKEVQLFLQDLKQPDVMYVELTRMDHG